MADRKVLVKYFPKNFNPNLLIKRGRGKDKLMNVRNMLPMSLRCNVCANYLYIGTKFNMRMQICNDETYLGIKVFRFYLKCTYCYNEIAFKTDPKNHDYVVEDGGTRNYEPIKDAEQAQKLLKKMKKDEKEGNSMQFLQNKTYDSKRQMELMQALDDIKTLNKRHAKIDPEDLLNNLFVEQEENQKFTEEEEREIEQRFNELRKHKLKQLGVIEEELEGQQKQKQQQQGQRQKEVVKLESKEQKMQEQVVPIRESAKTREQIIKASPLFSFEKEENNNGKKKSKMAKRKIIVKGRKDKEKEKDSQEEKQ